MYSIHKLEEQIRHYREAKGRKLKERFDHLHWFFANGSSHHVGQRLHGFAEHLSEHFYPHVRPSMLVDTLKYAYMHGKKEYDEKKDILPHIIPEKPEIKIENEDIDYE